MKNLNSFMLFTALLLFGGLAQAASYFVAPVDGEGIDKSLLFSVRKLVGAAVSEAGGDNAASEEEADFLLKPQLLKLGESWIVTMDKVKNGKGSGKAMFSSKLKAASTEELDLITTRLTRTVIKEIGPASDTQLGEVTENEEDQLTGHKIKSRNTSFFALGPHRFNNMYVPDADNVGFNFSWGSFFEVNRNAAIDLSFEWSFKTGDLHTKAYVAALQIGGLYFFGKYDTAPFLGADFGYGVAGADNTNSVLGFSGGARAGVMFFRNSTTQLSLSIRHLTIFQSNDQGVLPGHTGIVLGIHH